MYQEIVKKINKYIYVIIFIIMIILCYKIKEYFHPGHPHDNSKPREAKCNRPPYLYVPGSRCH